MKCTDVWVKTLSSSEKAWCLKETYRFHLQGRTVSQARNQQMEAAQLAACFNWLLAWLTVRTWRWRRYVPPKGWPFSELHGITTQKTASFTSTYTFSLCQILSEMNPTRKWTSGRILGFYSGGYELFYLLGYNAVWSVVTCLKAGLFLGIFFDSEDRGDMFFRNVGWLSTDYTALYPTRQKSSYCILIYSFRNQESSIGVAMGYRQDGRVSIPGWCNGLFSTPQLSDLLWAPPSLLATEPGSSIPGGKGDGKWSWPLTSI
jgi:hypothetical protein